MSSEALTRKAVEMALAGHPIAMPLCMERVLQPCHERTVKFRLPPIEGMLAGETCGLPSLSSDERGHLGARPR